jgi:hypothetical protein
MRAEQDRSAQEMQLLKDQMADQLRAQQEQMQQKMQEMMATMAGQAAPVESTGNAAVDARAKRRQKGDDEWEGGTGAAASKTDLNQLRASMKELEKTVMDVKAELEEERRALKLLEQKLKVGGFSSPAPGGRRAEDAWQRAKSAAARQVPAPGSRAVPVPGQAPTRAAPPRPVAVAVSIRRRFCGKRWQSGARLTLTHSAAHTLHRTPSRRAI